MTHCGQPTKPFWLEALQNSRQYFVNFSISTQDNLPNVYIAFSMETGGPRRYQKCPCLSIMWYWISNKLRLVRCCPSSENDLKWSRERDWSMTRSPKLRLSSQKNYRNRVIWSLTQCNTFVCLKDPLLSVCGRGVSFWRNRSTGSKHPWSIWWQCISRGVAGWSNQDCTGERSER